MTYRVIYRSMTASYGPSYIEADSALEARLKFARGAFSRDELSLIHATPVTAQELRDALHERERD